MGKIIWIVIAFLAGAFLPLQGGLNAVLGKVAKSPLHASMFSFIIGTGLIILYIAITRQSVSWEGLKSAPWYAWLGGLCGAFCLTAIILTMPKLGPGLTFGLIEAGQMNISVLLEHFQHTCSPAPPISFLRVVGILR